MLFHKILIFGALLLGFAAAAPTYYHPPASEGLQLDAREPLAIWQKIKQVAQAVKTVHNINQNFRPKPGEAVFWSGTRPGPKGERLSVHGDAQKFAHDHGKQTINHGLAQRNIKIPDRNQNKYSDKIWNKASAIWAHRASGDTHVVLGGSVRPNSVYNTIEKGILMKNKKVTKITEHNMETGISTVIKDHTKNHH